MNVTPFLIALGIVLYALFALFNNRAGGRIEPSLSSAIFNGLGAIIPLAVYFVLRGLRAGQTVPATTAGVLYSVLAGVAISAFSILLIALYGRGEQLSFVFPVVYGGAVALTGIVGWLLLHDHMTPLRGVGIAAIVAGVTMVAISAR